MDVSVKTLLEALPYMRAFRGQVIVIKYGGAAMEQADLKDEFARNVVLLKYIGMKPVVVHGGGPEITRQMERVGLKARFDSSGRRISDADTVDLAKMVLVGKINNEIVRDLNRHVGAFKALREGEEAPSAIGLCGDDGALFEVSRRIEESGGESLGLVGEVVSPDRVNVTVLEDLVADFIPVVASVGADRSGVSHNVNADEVAGVLAAALGAYKLVFLTDVPGLLSDPMDMDSKVSRVSLGEIRDLLASGTIVGGMVPKLESCVVALEHGVRAAHLIDGRNPHSLLIEMFTDAGTGTKIEAPEYGE